MCMLRQKQNGSLIFDAFRWFELELFQWRIREVFTYKTIYRYAIDILWLVAERRC